MIMIMHDDLVALFASAPVRTFAKGDTLFWRGDAVSTVYLVRGGRVALQRTAPTGQVLTLNTAGPGDMVAEAAAYSDTCHCDAVALEASELACLDRARFLRRLEAEPQLLHMWAGELAHSVQRARMRAEIRGLKKVSDRLDAWLEAGNTLPAHGQYQSVAAEIGVTREALYRELARRRGGRRDPALRR